MLCWVITGLENSNFCHRNSLCADFFHFTSCGSHDNSTHLRLPSSTTTYDSEMYRKKCQNIRKLYSHPAKNETSTSFPLSQWIWIIQLFNSVVTVQKFIIITNSSWLCDMTAKWHGDVKNEKNKKLKKKIRVVCSFKIQI